MFYFTLPAGQKYNWCARVAKHYPNVIARVKLLVETLSDENFKERGQRCISLLSRYVITTTPISQEIHTNIGKMMWRGLFGGSTTYSGLTLDVAKSALQKYIRRGMTEKALMVATEIFRLQEVGGDSAVSNLFNRILIIATEDIGLANLPLVIKVLKLLQPKSGKRDYDTLVAVVSELSTSKKTRLMSHYWYTYTNPIGRKTAEKYSIQLDKEIISVDDSKICLPSDPEDVKLLINIFYKKLQDKDANAFYWASLFLQSNEKITLTRRKKFLGDKRSNTTGKVDILLWRALSGFLSTSVHDVLVESYFELTEKRPFLQLAIAMAIHNLGNVSDFNLTTVNKQDYRLNKTILEVDDFVVDKHTKAGRDKGMGTKEFAVDGSIVIPEDPQFINETLQKIYRER